MSRPGAEPPRLGERTETPGADPSPPPPGAAATLATATAAALSRPAAWALALAAFLLRGGIVLFVLPFVVLPTTTGLGTLLAPILFRLVVGQPDPGAIALVTGLAAAALAWIALGGFVAAACEVAQVGLARAELAAWSGHPSASELAPPAPSATVTPATSVAALRVEVARLLALLPFAALGGWATLRIVEAAYAELQVPSDITIPLPVRVAARAAIPLAAAVVAFAAGELVGAAAARAVVLDRRGIVGSLAASVGSIARHPAATALGCLVAAGSALVLVGPALAATSYAWGRVQSTLPDVGPSASGAAAVLLLVTTWVGSLALTAVVAAWWGTWWTAEWGRRRAQTAARERARPAAREPAATAG